jgi:cytochrome P450 family 4
LAGYNFPKGTSISVYLHGIHLDPKNWTNPMEFMPERWETAVERHPFSFVPFSASERNCIGQKLAIQEALVILAHIVKNFKIESPNLSEVKLGMDVLLSPINLKVSFVPV